MNTKISRSTYENSNKSNICQKIFTYCRVIRIQIYVEVEKLLVAVKGRKGDSSFRKCEIIQRHDQKNKQYIKLYYIV